MAQLSECTRHSMIDEQLPSDWRDLQAGVARILREIGLAVEEEKPVATPRGSIEIDVYAIDRGSVDQISYVVECKNWSRRLDQSVIHSFTTVMHETGANIGFVISKYGLQRGAEGYLRNTNICGLTYSDFQSRYFPVWLERHFMPALGEASAALIEYTEPVNSRREKLIAGLGRAQRTEFVKLQEQYRGLGTIMVVMRAQQVLPLLGFDLGRPGPPDLPSLKKALEGAVPQKSPNLRAATYRELKNELLAMVAQVTDEFNCIFGRNIFAR